jgi:HSP20 family protein
MTELTLWRKQEIDKLRREMDLLFRRFRREFGLPRSLLEPTEAFSMKLFETENTITLRAELPDIKPEDIDISVTDEALTFRAQTREDTVEKGENFERVSQRSKSLSRTITLPCRIVSDDVKATYKDGILEIVLPKCKPPEARGVNIELNGG